MKKYVQLGYVSSDTSPIIGQRKLLFRAYLKRHNHLRCPMMGEVSFET